MKHQQPQRPTKAVPLTHYLAALLHYNTELNVYFWLICHNFSASTRMRWLICTSYQFKLCYSCVSNYHRTNNT